VSAAAPSSPEPGAATLAGGDVEQPGPQHKPLLRLGGGGPGRRAAARRRLGVGVLPFGAGTIHARRLTGLGLLTSNELHPKPFRDSATRPEAPLPVRPRPREAETADSYVRRLAAAIHLRFSYLRRYLAIPRGSFGPVDPGLLAALADRRPHAILRAFPELAPVPGPGTRHDPRQETQRSKAEAARRHRKAALQEKYAAIRRDDANGMSERAIERKHHVGRRTIVKAIASTETPPRKKFQRDPAALNGLHARIDAMLEADPGTRVSKIWQHLADDHGVTVTYPTLRAYVVQRRAELLPPPSAASGNACPVLLDVSR
jgi:transposase